MVEEFSAGGHQPIRVFRESAHSGIPELHGRSANRRLFAGARPHTEQRRLRLWRSDEPQAGDYDPALQPFINAVGIYGIVTPAQLCGIQVWIDGRNTNIGTMTEAGVDMNLKYRTRNVLGAWMLGLDATKVVGQGLLRCQ